MIQLKFCHTLSFLKFIGHNLYALTNKTPLWYRLGVGTRYNFLLIFHFLVEKINKRNYLFDSINGMAAFLT